MPRNKRYYNRTNTCDRCREEGRDTKLVPHTNAYRECNKEGNWTGTWLCKSCYDKDHYNSVVKNDPNSLNNIKKSLANRRTGNQNPNHSNAKGDLFQELTCIWRSTVSTIPVEDLNKKYDNYKSPIDHTRDSELGIIQTRGKFYDSYNQHWTFGHLEIEWKKEFDYEICYCVSEDGKTIDRIYIIPKKEIIKRTGISIYKNPTDCVGDPKIPWYEKYRIKDEETLKLVNEIWKIIWKNNISYRNSNLQ